MWFSANELRALLTMDRLLDDLQPGVLAELLGPLRKRLKELLDTGDHSAEEVARRIRVLSMGARDIEPAHFGTLALSGLILAGQALSRCRRLTRADRHSIQNLASAGFCFWLRLAGQLSSR